MKRMAKCLEGLPADGYRHCRDAVAFRIVAGVDGHAVDIQHCRQPGALFNIIKLSNVALSCELFLSNSDRSSIPASYEASPSSPSLTS